MTYVRAIRDGEMADKAGAFLVKSFEVIGNRRGGTKERKEKRIENGNEIRGGGGEERRGVSCSVATTLARLLFIGPRKGKTNTDCKRGSFFVGVVSRFGQDERKRVRFAFRSFTRRGWYCDETREGERGKKKKERTRALELSTPRGEWNLANGRCRNWPTNEQRMRRTNCLGLPDYVYTRLA